MRKQKGFSLIELLIVVAIILIIAAIAIPNLLRARIAANESSAVSSVRTINTAEVTYQSAYPTVGYTATLSELGPGAGNTACTVPTSTAACLIDSALASAVPATPKSGYEFSIISANGVGAGGLVLDYTVGTSAVVFNQTGVRDFCSSEDGVIHFDVPGAQQSSTTYAVAATCNGLPILQ